jgi:hypothetical protein
LPRHPDFEPAALLIANVAAATAVLLYALRS